jgi:hypothetical protein
MNDPAGMSAEKVKPGANRQGFMKTDGRHCPKGSVWRSGDKVIVAPCSAGRDWITRIFIACDSAFHAEPGNQPAPVPGP